MGAQAEQWLSSHFKSPRHVVDRCFLCLLALRDAALSRMKKSQRYDTGVRNNTHHLQTSYPLDVGI